MSNRRLLKVYAMYVTRAARDGLEAANLMEPCTTDNSTRRILWRAACYWQGMQRIQPNGSPIP